MHIFTKSATVFPYMVQEFDMLCTIKLKQQIVVSDTYYIQINLGSTCQKGRSCSGIILTENKFVQCRACYTDTKPYVHNQLV